MQSTIPSLAMNCAIPDSMDSMDKLMPKVVLLDDFLVCLCKTEIPAAVQPSSGELSNLAGSQQARQCAKAHKDESSAGIPHGTSLARDH